MQATLTGYTVAQFPPPVWMSLYSNQYDSDGLARQKSIDWAVKGASGQYLYKDYGAAIGVPDQYYFYQDIWVPLTKKRAEWLFNVQCLSWSGKRFNALTAAQKTFAKAEWKELFDDGRCFTNHTGTDTRHDYINGTHTDRIDMEYQLLLLGGNKVDVLGDVEMLPEKYFGIQKAYPHRLIRTVDIDHLPEPEAFLEDPYVCHLCTTIKPDGSHGLFPQFEGQARGVLWSKNGRAWIWTHLIGKRI